MAMLGGMPKPLINAGVTAGIDYAGWNGEGSPLVDGLTSGISAAVAEETTGGVLAWVNDAVVTVPAFIASIGTSLVGGAVYTFSQQWLLKSSPAGTGETWGDSLTLAAKYVGEDMVAKWLKFGTIGMLGEDGAAAVVDAAIDPVVE